MESESEFFMDTIGELCNIGSGSAATSLSKLLNKKVTIEVPKAYMAHTRDGIHFNLQDEQIAVVCDVKFQKEGGNEDGKLFIISNKKSIKEGVNILLGVNSETEEFGEMDESVVLEVGNILGSSMANQIANLMESKILISPPRMVQDNTISYASDIVTEAFSDPRFYFYAESNMKAENSSISLNVLIFPYFEFVSDVRNKFKC